MSSSEETEEGGRWRGQTPEHVDSEDEEQQCVE